MIPWLAALAPAPPPPSESPAHYAHTLAREEKPDRLVVLARDPRLRFLMHDPVVVMRGDGRQPFLFATARGVLFCQAQLNAPPFHSKNKMVYHDRIGSAISRDGGRTWTRWTHEENHDDVNIEGGAVERADGRVLLLDTYAMPRPGSPDRAVGELWTADADLRAFEGPKPADFHLPGIRYGGSTDDNGESHVALRLHRSLLELPNGDLLATMSARFDGDRAPCAYLPSMLKGRVVVNRSRDGGATWEYLATIGADGGVGTEGYGEPVLARVPRGRHAGRLIALMRTGRQLHAAHSDDDGVSWSHPRPVEFPGIDIYATERWAGRFHPPKTPRYLPEDDMIGAMVDPDLTAMRDGTLVCTVGARIPAQKFAEDWHVPENGDYLAFSCDGGDTWSAVVQFRSGAPTTQYMGVREISPGVLYVVHDDSVWHMPGRTLGFRLEVSRPGR